MKQNLNLLSRLFCKRRAIGKGALFGIVVMAPTGASAQTMYQCRACPTGTISRAGSSSSSDCISVYNKSGGNNVQITANSGTLSAGWYRISIKASDGAAGAASSRTCSEYQRSCTVNWSSTAGTSYNGCQSGESPHYDSLQSPACQCLKTVTRNCSGSAGGSGGEVYYVFYSNGEPYTMTAGSSPSLTVNGQKLYWATAGAQGNAGQFTNQSWVNPPGCIGGTNAATTHAACTAKAAGTNGTSSGQTSNTTVRELSGAGIKLMKILPALLGGYLAARWA